MTLWNMPNCIGALDGKHISIRKPPLSGSTYYNYKHFFSIILLALVDANYKFLFCSIGAQGRCSDGGVFGESDLNKALDTNAINVPDPAPLPGGDEPFPFCIIADDAFPLRNYLMKPFPHRNLEKRKRIFNYRITRARRCVENAFGIMANRFRVMLSPIILRPAKVKVIVQAACVMHNMLRTINPSTYTAGALSASHDGRDQALCVNAVSNSLQGAKVTGRRSATQSAKYYREKLCDYFNNEGSVSWQDHMV